MRSPPAAFRNIIIIFGSRAIGVELCPTTPEFGTYTDVPFPLLPPLR
jgi:hypothetical protein